MDPLVLFLSFFGLKQLNDPSFRVLEITAGEKPLIILGAAKAFIGESMFLRAEF